MICDYVIFIKVFSLIQAKKSAEDVIERVNEEYSVPAEITDAILTLKLEVEEKKRAISTLEKALVYNSIKKYYILKFI